MAWVLRCPDKYFTEPDHSVDISSKAVIYLMVVASTHTLKTDLKFVSAEIQMNSCQTGGEGQKLQ